MNSSFLYQHTDLLVRCAAVFIQGIVFVYYIITARRFFVGFYSQESKYRKSTSLNQQNEVIIPNYNDVADSN